MTDPAAYARAGEVGLEPGLGVYIVGRFGVLGRVDAGVVTAAAAFWNPATIRAAWEPALERCDPASVAAWYGGVCADYGRTHFAEAPGLARWCELAEAVADTAPVFGLATFAGWRAMPRPDDAPARAALLLHVLRELRFGLHANATVAAGLSPSVAMRTTPGMDAMVAAFGWEEPLEPVTDADVARREEIEATTDALSAASLGGLDADRAEELITLAEGIATAAN